MADWRKATREEIAEWIAHGTPEGETYRLHCGRGLEVQVPDSCGHPNHGADDHDCKPFTAPDPYDWGDVAARTIAEGLDYRGRERGAVVSAEPKFVTIELPRGALGGWHVLISALRQARTRTGYDLTFTGLIEQIEAQVEPPTVFDHYPASQSAGAAHSLCGKVWRPDPDRKSAGRCQTCTGLVESMWVR